MVFRRLWESDSDFGPSPSSSLYEVGFGLALVCTRNSAVRGVVLKSWQARLGIKGRLRPRRSVSTAGDWESKPLALALRKFARIMCLASEWKQ